MKIIVAGGGTAGHIIPNLAVLDELKKEISNLDVLYLGSKKGMESTLVPEKGWAFESISCGKLRRYFSWENFFDFFRFIKGIFDSVLILLRFKPDIVFCKGGYVSLPVAIAARMTGNKVIIHESDLKLGLANRIAARFANLLCVSFEETKNIYKGRVPIVITGNPVRGEILHGDREKGWAFSGLEEGKKVILIMGGSQGSKAINSLIKNQLEVLLKKYQVIHICGGGNMEDLPTKDGYFVQEFVGKELKDIYKISDIFIGRAGANTLSEIEALNIPAILIPLTSGSRGDQIDNAKAYIMSHPASRVIEEKDFLADREDYQIEDSFDLKQEIDILLKEQIHVGKKFSNSAKNIVEQILKLKK